mgnify:CR=1 FL=1
MEENTHKRVRRRAMNVETFARFCNRSSEKLTEAYLEFDPSPDEIVWMLERLFLNAKHLAPSQRRKTS